MMISVIIPALNEMECLPRTVAWLAGQAWVHELIVVDGGSRDGSREWLARQPGLRIVDSPAGKGKQLNAGAAAATGDLLLFVHADCLLPADAGVLIRQALANKRVVGGCFSVRFAEKKPRSLALMAAGLNFRSRLRRSATGDQGIFVRRGVFEKAGGCRDWPLFEDVELVGRIKGLGRFTVIPSPVTLSPRRYLAFGVWKTVFLIYLLRLGFWAGISPFKLKRWFEDVRPHLPGERHGAGERGGLTAGDHQLPGSQASPHAQRFGQ
jgi:rSAM/selenodomain-associated transferase 2